VGRFAASISRTRGFAFFLLSGNIQTRWHHTVDQAAFWALVKPDHPWETPLCKVVFGQTGVEKTCASQWIEVL